MFTFNIQVTFKSSVCLLQSDDVRGASWAWLAGKDGPVASLVWEFFTSVFTVATLPEVNTRVGGGVKECL